MNMQQGNHMRKRLNRKQREAISTLASRFSPHHKTSEVVSIGGSIACELRDNGRASILKITECSLPETTAAAARTNWISYLHRNGINVPKLVHSTSNSLFESVQIENSSFTGYCYLKIPLDVRDKSYWYQPTFIQRLGRTVGRMHSLAQTYKPDTKECMLPCWDDAPWIRKPESILHHSQTAIVERICELREELNTYNRTENNYGVIHDDLHTGNVFQSRHGLVIVDFDCTHCSWFVAEIASALLFRTWIGPEKEKPESRRVAIHFLKNLLLGYTEEHDIEEVWPEQIPLFLKLREISLFQSFYSHIDLNKPHKDAFLQYVYQSIKSRKPFIEIDFNQLA